MSFLYKDRDSNAKTCLTFEERPGTPPEIRKFRRSAYLEPGKRFQHPGIADDLNSMNLGERNYGVSSDKSNISAADLINHKKVTELQRMEMEKAEKVYRGAAREPLGRTADRNMPLPEQFVTGTAAFGIKSKSSLEPAKEIIFPHLTEDSFKGEEIYKKSHGNYNPGEQIRRDYKWPVDPTTTVFGAKGQTIAFNGVSKNIAEVLNGSAEEERLINTKKVEDFRNARDILGKSRNLGQGSADRGFDTVYGASKSKAIHTAAEVMKGRYSASDQLEDPDLGKSITPGFRNITVESRAFGCPSIRTDLPARPIGQRSVADSQNYGDDVPAQDLINPPAFSDLTIGPTAMSELRPKETILYTFKKIGYDLDRDILEAIYLDASKGRAMTSVNAFRDALNIYLNAVESNRENQWRQSHGL